ncbi:hypothetical protein HWV62_21152 [Athelia sp. TMB]|nr:hypothetical protein HWV62_21152 [Athelia sp. TMB]
MSNKQPSRMPPSASSPVLPSHSNSPPPNTTSQNQPSKLPKFLQKATRDRSRSINDPAASTASIASSSSGDSARPGKKKGLRLGGLRETFPTQSTTSLSSSQSPEGDDRERGSNGAPVDEPPVIIEPVPAPTPSNPFPRPRTRSERPISDMGHLPPHISTHHVSAYTNPNTPSSFSPSLPTRLTGWFSHTFSASSTDLTLPAILANQQAASTSPASPSKIRGNNPLLTAARHGGRHLDKAVRYLLDSDSQPDRCTDPIWIMGVQHPGYEPPPPTPPPSAFTPSNLGPKRRSSVSVDADLTGSHYSSSRREMSLSQSQPPSSTLRGAIRGGGIDKDAKERDPAAHWPPIFYQDFTSRIWLTYRSHFSPIRDASLAALPPPSLNPPPPQLSVAEEGDAGERWEMSPTGGGGKWAWIPIPGVGGEKSWTSDAGWGCMLRTGQSLLANALVGVHLGRDWRRPPHPLPTADYATYVQILTWFLDTPAPQAPFSVHRMALAGKELGTDVGCWFGPSVAAGAIRTLVNAFPEAHLGVAVANDGCLYQSEVFAASTAPVALSPTASPRSRRDRHKRDRGWGGRPVLVLVGIRLGINGVNPIYYETIKALYTFPQSVGIAGGRPSSSYYFVGSQADNLFYLDPHHARPAVPFRPPPRSQSPSSQAHRRMATSPASPSPLQKQVSVSSQSTSSLPRAPSDDDEDLDYAASARPSLQAPYQREREVRGRGLDATQEHYVNAYSTAELTTFHCERVRKMPLSGLDPSMLLGFLCKDEKEWLDFRRRLGRDYKTIFTIQDEPPTWPSDSDEFMGLESISEPDDMDMDDDDDEGQEPFFNDDDRGTPSSGAKSSEEDAVGPITPGPTRTAFETSKGKPKESEVREFEGDDDDDDDEEEDDDEEDDDDDDDEDWVDSSVMTPIDSPVSKAPRMAPSKSGSSTTSASSGGSGVLVSPIPKSKTTQSPSEPAPAHYPFPSSAEDIPQQQQNGHRMHTQRARDGGRTQSGGVKGVLTNDDR